MARTRRSSRGRSGGSQSNFFSRLIPDVIEKPGTTLGKGIVGLQYNLLTDVTDAAIGLPMGLVNLAKHPVQTVELTGKAMASTWSPLFTGHPLKFLQQTYDHPLAPILDIATVFTAGVGSAARGASVLSKAGLVSEGGRIAKVAALRGGGEAMIADPSRIGIALPKELSSRAGRRLIQNTMIQLDQAGKLPRWYRQTRYDTLQRTKMAHHGTTTQYVKGEATIRAQGLEKALTEGDMNYLAVRLQAESMLSGAEALEDITEVGKRLRPTILAHMHSGLARFATKVAPDDVGRVLRKTKLGKGRSAAKRHYTLVKAPEYVDSRYWTLLRRTEKSHDRISAKFAEARIKSEKQLARLEASRSANEALAAKVPQIEKDLAEASNELQKLRAEGHIATAETEMAPEMARLVRSYRADLRVANAAKVKHDDALARIEHLKQQRAGHEAQLQESFDKLESLRNRSVEEYFAYAGDSYESLISAVNNFGSKATTTKLEHAMRDADGNYLVVPLHDAYNLSYEGSHSLQTLHKIIHNPIMWWKRAVLFYTPRIITNNAVGNWFLYAARNSDPHGFRALYHTFRDRYGSEIDALYPKDHYMYRFFSDEMSDTFGVGNELVELGKARGVIGSFGRHGFYKWQYHIAEKPVRAATIRRALYDMPEIQQEIARLKRAGQTGPAALNRAIENVLEKRPDLRDRASLESRRLAGDYVTLRESEKFARDIIPFYLWQRHILKTTGNMLLEQPGRLAVATRLSDLGIDELKDELGDVPDFLRGAIPLAALGFGDKIGRANILLTSSLNPFATVGDMADGVKALVAGGNRRGAFFTGLGFGPYITGPIESATQTSLLTGAPSPRSGPLLTDILSRIVLSLPHIKAADALTGEHTTLTPTGKEYLFARDNIAPLSWLTGFTIKDLSKSTAAGIAAKEHGTVTKRGRTRRGRER